MYLGSSGHQNLKKKLPEETPPPEPPKDSKVAICTRGNVSEAFRSHTSHNKKHQEKSHSPGPTTDPKVVICTRAMYLGSSGYENMKKKVPERSSESLWKLPEL